MDEFADKSYRLRINATNAQGKENFSASEEMKKLVYELEVHQHELEMQNEELRATQAKLDETVSRYEDLFDLAPVGYLALRPNGTIIEANLTVSRMLEVDRNQLTGSSLSQFVVAKNQDSLLRHLRMTFKYNHCQTCDLELLRSDGKVFVAQLESIIRLVGDDLTPQCLTVCTDITERRQQEAMIHRQANYDALTELPNRVLFLDRLAYTIRLAHRESTHLALFFIDLDNFKWINDTYGHSAGDYVLKETARRLVKCARENDTVARLSGDEFCVLLPRVFSQASADRVARKVMAAMDPPFVIPSGTELSVACSIGIALYPKDGNTSEMLLNNADMALYQVKRAGRRQYAFFSTIMDEDIIRRQHQLSLELKHAIGRDELILHFQPVIDMNSYHPYGAEVLVRWQHPKYGLLLPAEFIPLAESNGTIVELGEWVLSRTVEQIRSWQQKRIKLAALWVNLSARQCGNDEGAKRLQRTLGGLTDWTGVPRLGLELTESEVLDLSDQTTRMFESLRQKEIFLSIDDFGTGYSSLHRLLHLSIDFIKVDKSFVANIATSEKSVKLVKTIVALGHSLNTRIVAEGIETPEQLEILQALGCDYGQGFHIAKPMDSDGIAEFLNNAG